MSESGLGVSEAAIRQNDGSAAYARAAIPVFEEFGDKLKSEVADIKNASGDAWGGASNAAAFLKFFVRDGIPWAHLDIAGTAWVNKPKPYHPLGATGAGVRLVTEYLAGG